ncbi:MAG: amino acid adenylation domain-containing protein, partial [Polyangiaceae bacterium]
MIAAAVVILLAQYTRSADVVVAVAGEQDEDAWPLRVKLSRADTARDLIARIVTLNAEARRHAMPLHAILEASGAASPLRVAIATPHAVLPGMSIVVRLAADDAITIDYDRAYERATIVRAVQALAVLLDEMNSHEDKPAADLRLLREEDERELVELGSGLSARPPFVPIDARVRAWADAQPDALAIRDQSGAMSYREYFERASRLASWILRHSRERNGRVGIYVERSNNLMIAELASWIAGHACVPFDARTPPARVAELLVECGASVVLCTSTTAARLEAPCVVGVFGEALDAELEAELLAPAYAWHPLEVAYIIFTSGSTGRPKGVRVPHGSFSTFIAYDIKTMKIGPGDRVIQKNSPGFDATMEEIWRALAAGAAVLVVDDDLPLSPSKFVRYLRDEGITHAGVPANLFEASVGEDWTNTKLRRLGTGVEKMPPFSKKFSFPVAHGYGPTETTIGATETLDIREIEGPAPIGRPLDDVRVYLLDDDLRLLPWGAMGELFIGGDLVTLGYLDPAPTAARFLPDPFAGPGARMYRTGDLVRWRPDRLLQFHGRVDTQLKLRGHRIEPGEIEAALLSDAHVAEAAALQVEAQSGPRLVAFAVAKPGHQLTADRLLAMLRAKLPPYMVPSAILLLDARPRTTRSKTARAALAALAARSVRTSSIAPRTADETVVANVFGAVLGVESVGALDDFFALGGHSLLVTKVVTSIRRETGIDLPVRVVFEAPTVEALARQVGRVREEGPEAMTIGEVEPPAIARRGAGAEMLASFGQEDIASFERSRGPSPVFLLDTRLAVSGRVEVDAISAAVRSALQRHDAFRTRFDIRGPRTKVTLAKAEEVSLEIADFRGSHDP